MFGARNVVTEVVAGEQLNAVGDRPGVVVGADVGVGVGEVFGGDLQQLGRGPAARVGGDQAGPGRVGGNGARAEPNTWCRSRVQGGRSRAWAVSRVAGASSAESRHHSAAADGEAVAVSDKVAAAQPQPACVAPGAHQIPGGGGEMVAQDRFPADAQGVART